MKEFKWLDRVKVTGGFYVGCGGDVLEQIDKSTYLVEISKIQGYTVITAKVIIEESFLEHKGY